MFVAAGSVDAMTEPGVWDHGLGGGGVLMDRQQGAVSLMGLVFLLMLFFIIFLAVKLVPAYMDDATISSAVQSISTETELGQKSASEIRSTIHKRLYINDFSGMLGITPEAKAISIKTGNGVAVDVDYKVKTHLFYNIDALQSFDHHYHFGGK